MTLTVIIKQFAFATVCCLFLMNFKQEQKTTLSTFNNNEYSLSVKSYLDAKKNKQLHCVINQDLIFKKDKKILTIKRSYLKNRTTDKKYLKYVVNEVGTGKENGLKVYVLKLYAANGEPEYCFVYRVDGKLLFYQKCNRKSCNIKILNMSKINPKDYFNKNTKFKDVENICY